MPDFITDNTSWLAGIGLYLVVFAVAVGVLCIVGRDTDDDLIDTDEEDHWEHLRTCDQPCCGGIKK